MKCEECGRKLEAGEDRFSYGSQLVCKSCLLNMARIGNTCPVCGTSIPQGDGEELAFALPMSETCRAYRGIENHKILGNEVFIMVCPGCHVFFVDPFLYDSLIELIPPGS